MSKAVAAKKKTAPQGKKNRAHGASRGWVQGDDRAPQGRKKGRLPDELRIIPIAFAGAVKPGDSLSRLLLGALKHHKLRPGDILVIKHKIVSKAEGQLVELKTIAPSAASRRWAERYHLDARVIELAIQQSRRIVRRKRGVLITETHHGLICALLPALPAKPAPSAWSDSGNWPSFL
jgi:F420-0:gamma-glutamyl ligase-like protein